MKKVLFLFSFFFSFYALGIEPVYTHEEMHTDSAIHLLHQHPNLINHTTEVWMLDSVHTMELPSEDKWWTHFNDEVLNKLIALGEENNADLKMAMKRLELSRNALSQARSGYFPTIGLSAGWEIARGSGVTGKERVAASTGSYFSLGATASWEVDLFGRVKENIKAGKAGVNVSRADYVGTMVSVCADIARNYFNLRLYQEQLEIALRHINSQKRILNITEAREEAGLASMLDVSQSRTVLYSTEASIPSLEALITTTRNSLGVLVGVNGNELESILGGYRPLPSSSQLVPRGVPADIIRRRPDILSAEYQLEEAAARIGVAKKDFLPSLSIDGSIGTEAHNIKDMFSGPSFTYMVSPRLTWTAFDGKLRNLRLAEQKLQLESDIESYNLIVMTAAEEVNNAIADYEAYQKEIKLREKVVEESERTLSLALDRYKQGLAGFTNVVDAQQDLLSNQNSYASCNNKSLQALIDLYVAMGGGWSRLPE